MITVATLMPKFPVAFGVGNRDSPGSVHHQYQLFCQAGLRLAHVTYKCPPHTILIYSSQLFSLSHPDSSLFSNVLCLKYKHR